MELAYKANQHAQQRMKGAYDRHAGKSTLAEGDYVLLKRTVTKPGQQSKFHLPWVGIFRIVDICHPNAIVINCAAPTSQPFKVHLNHLKPYTFLDGPALTLPTIAEEDKEALESLNAEPVETIPGHRNDSVTSHNKSTSAAPSTTSKSHSYNLRPRVHYFNSSPAPQPNVCVISDAPLETHRTYRTVSCSQLKFS